MKTSLGPPPPAMFARYKEGLEADLRAALAFPQEKSAQEDPRVPLYRMLQYHMGWADEKGELLEVPVSQGKALRPTLCFFACEALSGDWQTALPATAALELIHNFSLIHDDIQDGDVERRHRPTVWALWGQAQALVAGNAMRSIADITALRLTERGVPESKALQTSFLLTDGYLDMTEGQCLDLAFEDSLDIRLDDYLTMISCKTGALIRCGMEMGALIGSDDEASIQGFARCGSLLGLTFQIRDDVLGIWGKEASTGKAVGSDIRRKKKSFPVVYALETAKNASRQRLVDTYSKPDLDDEDVGDVLAVLEELGAAQYAQDVTCEKAALALEEVRHIPLPSWAHQEAGELVEFLTARQY